MGEFLQSWVGSLLASGNAVTVVLCMAISPISLHRALYGGLINSARRLAFGISSAAFGFVLQRGFWTINRILESWGYDFLQTQFYHRYSWVTLFAVPFILLGGGGMLSAFMEKFHKANWFIRYAVAIIGMWFMAAVAIKGMTP